MDRNLTATRRPVILLVAFGTTIPEAREVLKRIDERATARFPDAEIRWAYTSKIVRRRLAAQGTVLDSPEIALARLMDEGHLEATLLSLHVFPGREFHDLNHNVQLFSRMVKGFQRLRMAKPLLSSYEDLERVAAVLLDSLPAARGPDDAVVLVGHGNQAHPADMVYTAMGHVLSRLDPLVLVGTIQGKPGITEVLSQLRTLGVKKAWLVPFMAVAGEHARKDMAGEGPESWKSILTAHGIECRIELRGLAEVPAVVDIWLDHLRDVFSTANGIE
ncbi:MAG: sirohydrochlorin cobaltochelatase [Syntrophobacteraceae bacterium]